MSYTILYSVLHALSLFVEQGSYEKVAPRCSEQKPNQEMAHVFLRLKHDCCNRRSFRFLKSEISR